MVSSGATRGIPDGRRIVVKIGSKSLVSAADRFERIAKQVADLRAERRAVVIDLCLLLLCRVGDAIGDGIFRGKFDRGDAELNARDFFKRRGAR